jgi:hypothetical protein
LDEELSLQKPHTSAASIGHLPTRYKRRNGRGKKGAQRGSQKHELSSRERGGNERKKEGKQNKPKIEPK